MGSEFKLSSTAHSHSVRIVERSTSGTVALEVDRKMDENTDVPTMPPTTTLPPSDPGIPQDAGTHCIQSGCEHQSSGIDAASTALMQTSSHDCLTECAGYQRTRSFSCCDEPRENLSGHVCLSSARNASNSPSSIDKAVENVQNSSPVSNGIRKSSLTMTTGQNEVSRTSESEHTWSRHSLESSEWHTQRQGRQQIHSPGLIVLQVGESNTTPSQFLDIAVKNTQMSSPTPDDLWNSPMPDGTSTIGQTPPAGDCLQGAPNHDVTTDRYNSQSS
ncbi:hypothetical protein BDR03DRAFT_727884 [Suillus americanus]|nr:hypothetical protein BDR03DRAFT_727884 [Suillus americanus]